MWGGGDACGFYLTQENPDSSTPARLVYYQWHSYTLALGYSFGEADNYHTVTGARAWRLKLLKKTKIIAFFGWGKWWCPWLPVRDHPLNTVVRLDSGLWSWWLVVGRRRLGHTCHRIYVSGWLHNPTHVHTQTKSTTTVNRWATPSISLGRPTRPRRTSTSGTRSTSRSSRTCLNATRGRSGTGIGS